MKAKRSTLAKTFFESGKACPVYDVHVHMGKHYGIHLPYAESDAMVEAMDHAGVVCSFLSHHSALFLTEGGNAEAIEAAKRHPGRFYVYMGVDPNDEAKFERELEEFRKRPDIWLGFKFLADYHFAGIDNPIYQKALKIADAERKLVLMHTWGGSKWDGPDAIEPAFAKYKKATFIMGHAGHGEWDKTAKLLERYPNVYADTVAVMDDRGALERLVKGAGSRKILFGTDLPWFDYHYYIGGVLGAGVGDTACEDIFHRNAERILASLFRKKV